MKKLFTTLLMMGAVLTGWASVTASYDQGTKTLTINYTDEGNSSEIQNLNVEDLIKPHMRKAETLKLTGDWANGHLSKIGSMVERCIVTNGPDADPDKKVYLDLSACDNMTSYVKYTGEGDVDWISNNFTYMPDPNNPETVTVTGTATKDVKYENSWGGEYTGVVHQVGDDYYADNNGEPATWNKLVVKEIFVDENGNELPSNAEITDNGDETYSYSYTYTKSDSKFTFKDGNFSNSEKYLKGISFPNNPNFTAIPDEFFNNAASAYLEDVVFSDSLQWIGKLAFYNCSKLNNVTFPKTLKVIGVDAFYGCTNFTTVDLRIRDLVKVDAAAFNMGSDYEGEDGTPYVEGETVLKNKLATVYLPETDNTTLKFFANQVFSSSLVTELDFSHCLGITHFAYDGTASFGETAPANVSNANRTFTWHRFLTKVTLPPNLLHVGDECFFSCSSLQEAIFTGNAVYDNDCNLTNPLTIGEKAFKITPLTGSNFSNLRSVTFSNNIDSIAEQAFMDAQLTEVVFPGSIRYIGKQAFACADNAEPKGTLTKVVFDEIEAKYGDCNHAATVIATEAFNHQQSITDVYVNTETDITCRNWAFDMNITFAQGDVNGNAATLHFPAGHEAHYTNLQHPLTNEIAGDPGQFQAWLVQHYREAQDLSSGYGWYEFVNTGSMSTDPDNPDPEYDPDPEDPETLPLVLRTFSDPKYARIVPNGLRAYVVNNVQKDATNNNYVLTLQRLTVIPAQTGVVLFGQPNSKSQDGSYVISMSATQFAENNGQPLRRDHWDLLQGDDVIYKNYLMPIIDSLMWRTPAVEGVYDKTADTFEKQNNLTVYPFEPYVKGATVQWRNFALNRMSETKTLKTAEGLNFEASIDDFAGFFRIIKGTYKSGLAYLHLDATEYDDVTGAECVVTEDADYFKEYDTEGELYDPTTNADNKWWNKPNTWDNILKGWGKRGDKFNRPKAVQYLGELEDTDGVVELVVPQNKMDEVFSISGMKVANPSNGIYIVNGKKVIIK